MLDLPSQFMHCCQVYLFSLCEVCSINCVRAGIIVVFFLTFLETCYSLGIWCTSLLDSFHLTVRGSICASLGIFKVPNVTFVSTSPFLLYLTCINFLQNVFQHFHLFKVESILQICESHSDDTRCNCGEDFLQFRHSVKLSRTLFVSISSRSHDTRCNCGEDFLQFRHSVKLSRILFVSISPFFSVVKSLCNFFVAFNCLIRNKLPKVTFLCSQPTSTNG